MKPIADIRRSRLDDLIAEAGSSAELARRTGKDRRQVSAWSTGTKKISDVTARELEIECGKQPGWMDHESVMSSRSVHSDSPKPSQSQRLDEAKMRDAMTLLRHLADLTGVPGLVNDPAALVIAYEVIVEFDTPLGDSNVLDLTKRLAAKIRGNTGDTEERSKTA